MAWPAIQAKNNLNNAQADAIRRGQVPYPQQGTPPQSPPPAESNGHQSTPLGGTPIIGSNGHTIIAPNLSRPPSNGPQDLRWMGQQ